MFSESIDKFLHNEKEERETARTSMSEAARHASSAPTHLGGANINGHKESGTKIFFTKDYSRFVMLTGNRQLNRQKIKRIKSDIEDGVDLLRYCPIIVAEKDGKLEVIDGQHRLQVSRELGSQVWYIIADEITLLEIARMNSNTEKWKNKDFIHCYVAQGNNDYAKIDGFMKKYGFPLSVTLMLLTKGQMLWEGSGGNIKKKFEDGTIKVEKEEEATTIAETVMQFEDFQFKHTGGFVVAICKLLQADKIPVKEVISAYLANKEQLQSQSNWKSYLVNLETIVNIGKKQRRVIY